MRQTKQTIIGQGTSKPRENHTVDLHKEPFPNQSLKKKKNQPQFCSQFSSVRLMGQLIYAPDGIGWASSPGLRDLRGLQSSVGSFSRGGWNGQAMPGLFLSIQPLSNRMDGHLFIVSQGSQESKSASFRAFQNLVQCYFCSILLVKASHTAIPDSGEKKIDPTSR